ncbi:D-glycero-beta-D-manno-heptose 1-phosphate adenylyltransferase [Hugenholtzia roseola]|uniref:D-glycero-beta-D-manno-heptose 1-phosphate adenylyltransferase n=1 Tax=Hugenholtzia roseola TaxID=1002 RepID=UPI000428FDA2
MRHLTEKKMCADKICASLSEAAKLTETWRNQGNEVVFTNGCFDILHLGHVDYLEKASLLGTKLIVGLNSDNSIKRLKGEKRPLNPEYARLRLLASLAFVDAVVLFEQDTPLALIEALRPDVLVKGGDYEPENIVGADFVSENGGIVQTIPLVEGFSTTGIIAKMS